jgi:hypothetical protein
MTEAEWLTCTDPQPMLEFLRGKVSERKLRLFAVACCRRIWGLLTDSRDRQLVDTIERFADGHEAFGSVLSAWRNQLRSVPEQDQGSANDHYVRRLASDVVREIGWVTGNVPIVEVAQTACSAVAATAKDEALAGGLEASRVFPNPPKILADRAISAGKAARELEERAQVTLVRCIFDNPFRTVIFNSAWRAANVTALAQSIYDERAFDRMPILADALEDAGCDNTQILEHCRSGGEHVRGCWVVGLVLGKN